MDTIENNKLINDFISNFCALKSDNYHNNWNDLIFVIEKITRLGISYDDKGNELFLKIGENLCLLNIGSTYKAVVDVIKWYNQQKS